MNPEPDMSDFDSQRKALEASMEKIAKKSKSKTAKNVVSRSSGNKELPRIVHKLVDETLDMYLTGDEPWSELVKDLSKALMVIETK